MTSACCAVLCHAMLSPQEYSAAFLGMENAAYCAWITNPAHWGGGIDLAILASHYRREIAAWNLATGACHVFGEDAGRGGGGQGGGVCDCIVGGWGAIAVVASSLQSWLCSTRERLRPGTLPQALPVCLGRAQVCLCWKDCFSYHICSVYAGRCGWCVLCDSQRLANTWACLCAATTCYV